MSQVCDQHCNAISVKTDGSVAQQATINILKESRQQACQACTMNCDNHDSLQVQSGGSKRKYKKRRSGKKKRKSMKKKRKSMKKKR